MIDIEAKYACTVSGIGFEAWRHRPAYRVHCATARIAKLLCESDKGLGSFRCLRPYRDAQANALRHRVACYIVDMRRGTVPEPKEGVRYLTLVIDLDERGWFKGHVETQNAQVIFAFSNEGDDGWPQEDGLWLVSDGYMRHARDAQGLLEYLQTAGLATCSDKIIVRG